MALDQSALLELLDVMRSADGGDLMRRLLATIVQLLVDAEATAFVGAEPHERTEARANLRNGTRDKLVSTATGDITVKIPKVHSGSFFPSLLAPRRRVDVALHAVVMQASISTIPKSVYAGPDSGRTSLRLNLNHAFPTQVLGTDISLTSAARATPRIA